MDVKQILVTVLFRIISLIIGFFFLVILLFKRWKNGEGFFDVKPRPTQPHILGDRRWGNHSFVTLKKQGIKLHYVEKGDRSNPLLVCLHGFPECWFSWRHQLEEFSSKYWVVAVDMRGYGDSDKPQSTSSYRTDLLVEDMREFIETISNGNKCTIMAHDWGGAIAWYLVDLYPHMFINHISCNAPHFGAFSEILKSSFAQKRKSWYMSFFLNPWLPELMIKAQDLKSLEIFFRGPKNRVDAFPDEVIEAYKYYYSQKDALTPPINYYRNIDFAERFTVTKEIKKIKVPTLVIWGLEDTALDQSIAVAATKYCEDIQLKFVDGTSHWVQQEEPKHVNSLIWEYFSTHK